jgi:hypothetical protein
MISLKTGFQAVSKVVVEITNQGRCRQNIWEHGIPVLLRRFCEYGRLAFASRIVRGVGIGQRGAFRHPGHRRSGK